VNLIHAFRQIISIDLFHLYRTDSADYIGPFTVFILLNGWICWHGVLD